MTANKRKVFTYFVEQVADSRALRGDKIALTYRGLCLPSRQSLKLPYRLVPRKFYWVHLSMSSRYMSISEPLVRSKYSSWISLIIRPKACLLTGNRSDINALLTIYFGDHHTINLRLRHVASEPRQSGQRKEPGT